MVFQANPKDHCEPEYSPVLGEVPSFASSSKTRENPAREIRVTQDSKKSFVARPVLRGEVRQHPYRKPTPVDEESILRRTGQYSFRNSAK